jgi:DNA modification methylase
MRRFDVSSGKVLLDPFCGTGTTLVEAKKNGVASIGVEAVPVSHLAASVKTDWSVNPNQLLAHADQIAAKATSQLEIDGIVDEASPRNIQAVANGLELRGLDADQMRLLLKDSISPLPLHKALVLLDSIDAEFDPRLIHHEHIALATVLVGTSSNLHFGPEVGIRNPKSDAPVIEPWLDKLREIASDLQLLADRQEVPATVHLADARNLDGVLERESVDAVITSPPYPNEKDYTRTVRLESVLLGHIRNRKDLRALKQGLLRSNTRGVYKADTDDQWVEGHEEITAIADAIEARRKELGKTSGFERTYPRVTKLYFGGMARHFVSLSRALKPGARLAYVVGDQASYLRIMIRTGALLADIADSQGYEVESIDLFRTRRATATRAELREEVVVLRWPG